MKIKEEKKKENKWDLIEDLKWRFKIYYMLEYIELRQVCNASELRNNNDFCKTTLYNYLNKAVTMSLIDKVPEGSTDKNGAQFRYIAKPELTPYLNQFRKLIVDFSGNLPSFHNNF